MSSILASRQITVGIIGCGNISSAYSNGCKMFRKLKLKACADLNMDTASAKAAEFGITAMTIEQLLADPEIEIVVNLTIPKVHAKVSMDILKAGKHVYSEKPLATDLESGKALLDFAKEKGLRVGCAPDTFLGAGLQTCRKLIDDNWIGKPIGGTAFMLSSGPESWHPNPFFFFEKGAGPMLDMGPYYVTALIHLLGPVQAVSAMTSRTRSERMATSKEQFGRMLPVEVPTHYSGSLLFENGAIVTMVMSFDVQKHNQKHIEIYGSTGSLSVPDPNTFGGPVMLSAVNHEGWNEMPFAFSYGENSRGIGTADMAYAIESGRPHRCEGSMALHVLEVMCAFEKSQDSKAWVEIENRCAQPQAFPLGMTKGILDS